MSEATITGAIQIPAGITDLESFRRWCLSDDFPEQGNISFLNGRLWVDLNMERDIHNQIKLQICITLGVLVNKKKLGRLYGDRMRLVHPEANLASEPDAMFLSKQSLQRQRVQLRKGVDSREVVGSPDMVLEVVSDSSVEKDTVTLLDLYHKARVREYWLVNPLGDKIDFKIYRYAPEQFIEVHPVRGWLASEVFNQSFRLIESTDESDLLEVRLKAR